MEGLKGKDLSRAQDALAGLMRSGMSDALAKTSFAAQSSQHAPASAPSSSYAPSSFSSSALMQSGGVGLMSSAQPGVPVTVDTGSWGEGGGSGSAPPSRGAATGTESALGGGGLLWGGSTAGATPGATGATTGLYFGPAMQAYLASRQTNTMPRLGGSFLSYEGGSARAGSAGGAGGGESVMRWPAQQTAEPLNIPVESIE